MDDSAGDQLNIRKIANSGGFECSILDLAEQAGCSGALMIRGSFLVNPASLPYDRCCQFSVRSDGFDDSGYELAAPLTFLLIDDLKFQSVAAGIEDETFMLTSGLQLVSHEAEVSIDSRIDAGTGVFFSRTRKIFPCRRVNPTAPH